MSGFKIKRDDTVVVIAGSHKGERGRVLNLDTVRGRVTVEKVNMVQRRIKPRGDQGGTTINKEAPIAISNVALWKDGRVKVGWKFAEDGRKVRYAKGTGALLD